MFREEKMNVITNSDMLKQFYSTEYQMYKKELKRDKNSIPSHIIKYYYHSRRNFKLEKFEVQKLEIEEYYDHKETETGIIKVNVHVNVKVKMVFEPEKDLDKLTKILVRYTIGFGLIEVLLSDEEIQDVSVNSPLGKTPIFIVHGKYGDCTTNIMTTINEAESWASKLRLISGRPLDEANPVLDTELELPGANTRVAAVLV